MHEISFRQSKMPREIFLDHAIRVQLPPKRHLSTEQQSYRSHRMNSNSDLRYPNNQNSYNKM